MYFCAIFICCVLRCVVACCLVTWFTPACSQLTLLLALTIPVTLRPGAYTHIKTRTCVCTYYMQYIQSHRHKYNDRGIAHKRHMAHLHTYTYAHAHSLVYVYAHTHNMRVHLSVRFVYFVFHYLYDSTHTMHRRCMKLQPMFIALLLMMTSCGGKSKL